MNGSTQTSNRVEKRAAQNKFIEDGIRRWKEKQDDYRIKKLAEQKEMKNMLERYWPWNNPTKPRGLRNLNLEGIFPEEDFKNSKRFVGPLQLGRPGGGAPIVSQNSKMLVRTHEDPVLRFQWGTDLRNWIDNTYRYKSNKHDQEKYKKELDKLVQEKRRRQEIEKKDKLDFERKQFLKTPSWGKPGPGGKPWRPPRNIGLNFLKSLGWSNEATLKRLEEERLKYKEQMRKEYNKFLKMKLTEPNRIEKLESIKHPSISRNKKNSVDVKPYIPKTRVPPLGEELVPLLAKPRTKPKNVALSSTDVTRGGMKSFVPKWKLEGAEYLRELSKQMNNKNESMQQTKTKEMECEQRHFSTWDSFWGRPGNGAPRSAIRKGRLDRLLYPQMVPICVH